MAARALLPPLVADAVREALDVALPTGLGVPWHGATYDERARLLRRAWDEAPEHGAGTEHDIDPFVRDSFQLLAHPEVSVELVVGDVKAKRDEYAVVASGGGFALLARFDRTRGLLLEAVRPTGLGATLVGLLPAHPPGRGPSASVPTEAVNRAGARAGAHPAALERELVRAGVRQVDAEVIAGVLTAPRRRTGQFSAIGFEQHGAKGHVVDLAVGFVDTDAGRYLTQDRPGPNGNHLTIAPADNAKLLERIGELVELAYAAR
jgi:EspG family